MRVNAIEILFFFFFDECYLPKEFLLRNLFRNNDFSEELPSSHGEEDDDFG